jgi:hypothetical protein
VNKSELVPKDERGYRKKNKSRKSEMRKKQERRNGRSSSQVTKR